MSQVKIKSLATLFNSYPALTWSVEATKAKLETYLDVLASYSDDTVRTACGNIMRQDRAFPPSAGELRAESEKIAAKQAPIRKPYNHNEPPPDLRTPEEKEAAKLRVAKMIAEFKAGLPAPEPIIGGRSRHMEKGQVTISSALTESMFNIMGKE